MYSLMRSKIIFVGKAFVTIKTSVRFLSCMNFLMNSKITVSTLVLCDKDYFYLPLFPQCGIFSTYDTVQHITMEGQTAQTTFCNNGASVWYHSIGAVPTFLPRTVRPACGCGFRDKIS